MKISTLPATTHYYFNGWVHHFRNWIYFHVSFDCRTMKWKLPLQYMAYSHRAHKYHAYSYSFTCIYVVRWGLFQSPSPKWTSSTGKKHRGFVSQFLLHPSPPVVLFLGVTNTIVFQSAPYELPPKQMTEFNPMRICHIFTCLHSHN